MIEASIQRFANSGALDHRAELEEIITKIEVAIGRAGLKLDRLVYAGEFPTGSFNAQVQAVTEGAIILINSGLFWFIYQAMKILSLSVLFSDAPEKQEERYSEDEKVEAVAEMVLAYLFFEDILNKTTRIPLRGPARMQVAADLWQACVFFAVAHEYGHILAGHLTRTRFGNCNYGCGRYQSGPKGVGSGI